MVRAVDLGGVADHLTATTIIEVDINIWHRDSGRVQEPLEDQPVLDRVHLGDVGAIGDHRTTCRTAARTDLDTNLTGVPAQVRNDQEIGRKTHLFDHRQLVLNAFLHCVRHRRPVPLDRAFVDLMTQKLGLTHPIRARKRRQQIKVKLNLDVAHLGNIERGVQRRREVPEPLTHLSGGLHVEVCAVEPEPIRIRDLRASLDAQQHVMRFGVLGLGVVRIVGDDGPQPKLGRQLLQLRPGLSLLCDPVVLQLNEVALRTKDVLEVTQDLFRLGLVVLDQRLVYLGTQTAG